MKYSKQKLTKDQVKIILRRRCAGENYAEIAKDYPVSLFAIGQICTGKTWNKDESVNRLRAAIPEAVKIRKYRTVDIGELKRYYFAGLTAREISREMGFTEATINTVLRREGIAGTRPQNTNKKGESHNRAKLSEKDVIDILLIRLEGDLTQKEIAQMYNVTTSTIWAICSGKSWNHPELKAIKFLRQKVKLAGK